MKVVRSLHVRIAQKGFKGAILDLLNPRTWIRALRRRLLQYKQRRFASGENLVVVDLPTLTVDKNRQIWNDYDWSLSGEEWTDHVREYRGLEPKQWKQALIDGMMRKYIQPGSVVLEIGPGAGRWTAELAPLAGRLLVADITERCLDICRDRFREYAHIEYYLIERGLDFIEDNSLDYIWSYDVFVHINPSDVSAYIRDFFRVLKPGGIAIIHHAGQYPTEKERRQGLRTYMSRDLFAHFVAKHGLNMVEQNEKLAHKPGDIISVFAKPSSSLAG
ncbi:MAG: class I SAM-dependent methyltransferase [Chloroflexi bacterium]|nr:class I SAM-dependent methyltransferase [Chloroflexota bacterium]